MILNHAQPRILLYERASNPAIDSLQATLPDCGFIAIDGAEEVPLSPPESVVFQANGAR